MGAFIGNPRLFGTRVNRFAWLRRRAALCAVVVTAFLTPVILLPSFCSAQVFTVERAHVPAHIANLTVVSPTMVPLPTTSITPLGRETLIRAFQSVQAFDVRPLPRGRHGLTLQANGNLSPNGQDYIDDLEKNGISSKPGDRLVITKFDIKDKSIIFEFNGGPTKPHRFLRHIQVGGGIGMAPLAQDNGEVPIGSRLTLTFDKFVPELTADQLRELISPVLDFSAKTPVQAYADTLPPKLKQAVLHHEVLVGMDKNMVIHSIGAPPVKDRETEDNRPVEIWIYGHAPEEVKFVHFQNERVTRLEIARVGQPLMILSKDETGGYFSGTFVHHVWLGDAPPPGSQQAEISRPAPTLRTPGEKLPDVVNKDRQLKPVQFPDKDKKKPEPQPIPPPPGQSPEDQLPLPPPGPQPPPQ